MENNNEISLVYVIKLIYQYWKNNKLRIALFFLAPVALMSVYHFSSKNSFSSQSSYKCETITFNLINQIYDPVLKAINTGQVNKAARLLGIPNEEAMYLRHTSIAEIKNPTIQEKGCNFSIEISTSDSALIKKMAEPLTNFFLNNQYVVVIQNATKNKLENNLKGIEEQIIRLNAVQKEVPQALRDQSQNSMISDLGLGEIYFEMSNLYQLKNETIKNLELISEVKLVSGFSFIQKNGGLIKQLIIGVVIGFFITLFAILYKGLIVVIKD